MKKTLIAMAVLGAASGFAMAASNVTLYGFIETGVLVQKAKHQDTTVSMVSGFDQGSRWGIRGVEELGNGYNVGFVLEQGFDSNSGKNTASNSEGRTFGREAQMFVQGGFGKLGFGRFGTLSSGAGSYQILTGWALGTGYGLSSWTSAIGTSFSRADNAIAYASPKFGGFSVHVAYSNGVARDTKKWSENNHYYGLGIKYEENAIRSSLILEALDGKGSTQTTSSDPDTLDDGTPVKVPYTYEKDNGKPKYAINYGLEYNLGSWTPMFAYQFATQKGGNRTHMFGLSAKVSVAGGDALIGARYLFGDQKYNTKDEESVRSWNIGAAYVYPLSKRTALKAYAGYADSSKGWKDKSTNAAGEVTPVYNGYQVFFGMRHQF